MRNDILFKVQMVRSQTIAMHIGLLAGVFTYGMVSRYRDSTSHQVVRLLRDIIHLRLTYNLWYGLYELYNSAWYRPDSSIATS